MSRVFRAPGRVNLIGEHTDYNDGFVMPAAIHLETKVHATPREDRLVKAVSKLYIGPVEFSLDDTSAKKRGGWGDYIQGVALALEHNGYPLQGVDMQFESTVPIGAGLSSSAALEVSAACALAALSGHEIPPMELAQICQQAENEFVGMRCGIMDQFVALHGVQDNALLLDCRSLEYKSVPLPENIRLVIANTMVKHELTDGAYNDRRSDCETAAQHFGAASLRDVTEEMIATEGEGLDERMKMRATHVVREILRTEQAADALRNSDIEMFGKLMYESHESLRDLYEVSCRELDIMVDLASKADGVFGSRMTGAGFGGCTITLIEEGSVKAFQRQLAIDYKRATGIEPEIYICRAIDGASEIVL